MFEVVETNAAAILTIIVLWCTLTWMATYIYYSRIMFKKQETIEVLDMCIADYAHHTDNLRAHIDWQDRRIAELEGHTCINEKIVLPCQPCDDEAERMYAEQGGQ